MSAVEWGWSWHYLTQPDEALPMTPKKAATDASTDPNDKATEGQPDRRSEERDDSPAAAVERVLGFAEGRGEEYPGAVNDHAIIRAALADGNIVVAGPN